MEFAYAMMWDDFKEMVLKQYCPRNEVKKLEVEFWNLKVHDNDMAAYNQRFQELVLLCPDGSNWGEVAWEVCGRIA